MPDFTRNQRTTGVAGTFISIFPDPIITDRAPTTADRAEIGRVWIDRTLDDAYFLTSFSGTATWINAGGGSGTFASVTTTGAIISGTTMTVGTDLTVSGLGLGVVQSSATGLFSSSDGTDGQILIADTNAANPPVWANLASADATVTITNGAGTIDLSVPAVPAGSFPTDAGAATPAAGVTNFLGGTNANTAGAGNTVTINVDNAPTFSGLVTGQAGLTVSGAVSTTITSTNNAVRAIYLHANGGVLETIDLHSDQGTSVNSVFLLSDLGGITLQAVGLASDDAINLEADAGGVDIDAAMQINIASSEAAADAIRIVASAAAGGIDIDDGGGGTRLNSQGEISLDAVAASNFTVVGAGIDLTLASTGGRIIVQGDEATANAVTISSTGGGIDADCVGQMNLDSSQAAVDAIRIFASNAAGGLDLDVGTAGMVLTAANGTVALESGTGAINIGVDAAAHTVTIGNSTGATSVVVDSGTGNLDLGVNATDHSTTLGSTNGASLTTVQSGTSGLTLSAAGNVRMTPSTATDATGPGATAAVTINANVGVATLQSFTTAAGGTLVLTITNSVAGVGSAILSSASVVGAEDAQMTITKTELNAGAFVVTLTNNGAAALASDVIVTFWIIAA